MKMKRNTDWTDVMRDALRDTEIAPSEGGWERLLRDLDAAAPQRMASGQLPSEAESREAGPSPAGASRRSPWRIYGLRIVAAAAAVLICVVAGEYLWRPEQLAEGEVSVVAKETGSADSADGLPQKVGTPIPDSGASGSETLRKSLARTTGWSQSPAAETATDRDGVAETARTALLAEAATVGEETTRAAESVRQSPATERGAEIASDEAVGTKSVTPASASSALSAGECADTATPDADAANAGQTAQIRPAAEPSIRTPATDNGDARYRSARTYGFHADEDSDAARLSRPRASFSFFAAGGTSSGGSLRPEMGFTSAPMGDASTIIGNGNDLGLLKWRNYNESSFRHHLPLSFGLSVRAELPYRLSLESGVNYTLLRSDVRMPFSTEEMSQKLHFIGVPLRLNWQFVERGRFSAYLAGGMMVEKCVSATLDGESVDEQNLQWSLLAALGAQYRLSGMVGLYFEPEASYYLTDTKLRTSRSDAPLSLTLRIGVRLLF